MYHQIILLLQQIAAMFLLIGVGFCVYRIGILDNHTTKHLSSLLVRVVTPCILISSFQREFDAALGRTLFFTFICCYLSFGLCIVISNLIYRKGKYENFDVRRMCAVFSNNGFMALPLLDALFGSYGIFLGSAHIVTGTTLAWTYGLQQLTDDKGGVKLKKIFVNPGVFALVCGIIVFISPIKLPGLVFQTISYVGSLNTPLAMIVLGCFLAQTDLFKSLIDPDILKISFIRLLLLPMATIVFLIFLPLDLTSQTIILLGVCTPVAIASATMAQIYGRDFLYCARSIAVSTLLSAVTIPLMLLLHNWLYYLVH